MSISHITLPATQRVLNKPALLRGDEGLCASARVEVRFKHHQRGERSYFVALPQAGEQPELALGGN